MKVNRNDETEFILPHSIRLLFENEQLELVKTLCLFYAFYKKSSRKFNKIPDVIFYYCLVNYDMVELIKSESETVTTPRNFYYKYQNNINDIILNLFVLQFVDVKGNINSKVSDISIKITNKGLEFIENMTSSYFTELISNYLKVLSEVDSNTQNKNKLKGGVR